MGQRPSSVWAAWWLASRPKTLAASTVPVVVASALAWQMGQFKAVPAILCLLFAVLAQVASNLSNDYFDFIHKTDNEERLGPERAVASGWITPSLMKRGIFIVIALACIIGSGLIYYGGWKMIIVGVTCVVALLAYSAGPWPLSYHGLGDVFVLVFFGLVAVVFTYYVQALQVDWLAILCGTIVGLGAGNILVLNNYRDRETDKKSHKNTTVVLFGEAFGRYFYLLNGLVALILCLLFLARGLMWPAILPWLYLPFHWATWNKMVRIREGRALNALLGETSRNLLWLGGLLTLGLLLG
jgi:1,4-dihydroxy-2-naphthoate octaprenyltransferase